MSYKDNPKTKEITEKRYEAIRLLGKYYKYVKKRIYRRKQKRPNENYDG